MDTRYQVFISSTYEDLKEERAEIFKKALGIRCIPVGMEAFGAADKKQMDYIKKLIDQTDYYVLILGGRYGSVEPNSGKSYTHLEYEYAVEQGVPVLVFVHADKDAMPKEKRDTDPDKIKKLNLLIDEATKQRLRETWADTSDLCQKFLTAMANAKQEMPRSGWVRAEKIQTDEIRHSSEVGQNAPTVQNYLGLDEKLELTFVGAIAYQRGVEEFETQVERTPTELIFEFGDQFRVSISEQRAIEIISVSTRNAYVKDVHELLVSLILLPKIALRILYHFERLGLFENMTSNTSGDTYWRLTKKGSEFLADQLAFKKTEAKQETSSEPASPK